MVYIVILAILIAGGLAVVYTTRRSSQVRGINSRALGAAKQGQPLGSVLVRDVDIYAANEEGLFRALKADKQWRRLPIPETMPTNGFFTANPELSQDIFYFVPVDEDAHKHSAEKQVFGLYWSRDNGRNWQLLSKDYNFRHLFLHETGDMYAIVEAKFEVVEQPISGARVNDKKKPRRVIIQQRLLLSRDRGRTWREITGNIAQGVQLFGIFADPDNPKLVCLNGWGNRGYILQAKNEDYEWEMIIDSAWRDAHETEESFFKRSYGSRSIKHIMHRATLTNYFQYDFGTATDLPAFDIAPEQRDYTFAEDASKIIRINVQFLPATTTVSLFDTESAADCWSLRVMPPQGKGTYHQARHPQHERTRTGDIQTFTVSSRQPYTREIDLAQFYTFPEKGVYKVQLHYDNKRIADALKGKWSGFFSGQVFTVTIE